jgi:hypothetical protein
VIVKGNITGAGSGSASIHAFGNIKAVVVQGDVTGGTGDYSAQIVADGVPQNSHGPFIGGRITSVTVTGQVTGGVGNESAEIFGTFHVGAVRLGKLAPQGGLHGGGGTDSGSIQSNGSISSVTVNGDVTGGAGSKSGSISATYTYLTGYGRLGPVVVVGNLQGGTGPRSAEIHGYDIGPVRIIGAVTGGSGIGSACIHAERKLTQVLVDFDWIGASISAGLDPGPDGYYGTLDDVPITSAKGDVFGYIGQIAIGGNVNGTAVGGDHFAFDADDIGNLRINHQAVPLTPGPNNDPDVTIPTVTTGDFDCFEL